MHLERRAFVLGLALAAVASACGNGSLQNGSACLELSETACRARPDCALGTCATCASTPEFAGCYSPGHDQPPACAQLGSLPCPLPPPCAALDETSCRARTDCQVFTCSTCGDPSFASCGPTGAPTISCPAVSCPVSCARFADQASCDASGICHSVFADSGICDCSTPGCCTHFSSCADGAKATCTPPSPILCRIATPACEGPYVVSYTSNCYEGCVLSSACGL
jgi:hypothetical protein